MVGLIVGGPPQPAMVLPQALEQLLRRPDALAGAQAADLLPIFQMAEPKLKVGGLAAFLTDHLETVGYKLFQTAGLCFSGIPHRSVVEIETEAALAREISRFLAAHGEQASALAHLHAVRAALFADPRWAWAQDPPPPVPEHPRDDPSLGQTIATASKLHRDLPMARTAGLRALGDLVGLAGRGMTMASERPLLGDGGPQQVRALSVSTPGSVHS